MKLRDLLDDVALLLFMDIIRHHTTSIDYGEQLMFKLLDMDVTMPSLDTKISREIAKAISTGDATSGFISALLQFVINHHPKTAPSSSIGQTNQCALPPPRLHELPWNAGTEPHDFFLWLYEAPRTEDQALMRWPRETVKTLWKYFKDGRMNEYGYTTEVGARDDVETVQIKLCENTTTTG